VIILGRGWLVGYPIGSMLMSRMANVKILNEFSGDIAPYIKDADIVISGTGKRHLVKGKWIKPGAVVIDVGCSKGISGVDKHKVVGDIEFEEVISLNILKI